MNKFFVLLGVLISSTWQIEASPHITQGFRQSLQNVLAMRQRAVLSGFTDLFDDSVNQAQELLDKIEINLNAHNTLSENKNNTESIQAAVALSKVMFEDIAALQLLIADLDKLVQNLPQEKKEEIRPMSTTAEGSLRRLQARPSKRGQTIRPRALRKKGTATPGENLHTRPTHSLDTHERSEEQFIR
jgi:hypothetical protein